MDEQIVVFQLGVFGWLLTLGAVVAVATAPKLARALRRSMGTRGGSTPVSRLGLVVAVQNLIFIAIAAALGAATAHRVGLHAPLFEALASGGPVAPAVIPQLTPAIGWGTAGALVFLVAYYKVFRPRFDESLIASERLRFEIGIVVRMMQGGVIEEIMFRWGLMSALVWVGAEIVGGPTQLVMWAAIVVAGVLFGLAHLPAARLTDVKMSTVVILTTVVLNLWGGMVFGWLFWRYGLLSAMIAHALFHLVWFPFERRVIRLEGPSPRLAGFITATPAGSPPDPSPSRPNSHIHPAPKDAVTSNIRQISLALDPVFEPNPKLEVGSGSSRNSSIPHDLLPSLLL